MAGTKAAKRGEASAERDAATKRARQRMSVLELAAAHAF